MVSSHLIARNALYLTIASIFRKALTFLYFVIVARYMGVNTTGLFYLTICYGALFYIAMDFGLTHVFIRNASREPAQLGPLLSETLSLKLVLAVVGAGTVFLLVNLLGYPAITKDLIYVVVATMVLQSFSISFFACFRVLHQMRYEAIGMVIGKFLMLAFGGSAVFFRLSPYYLIVAIALDGIFNFLFSWYFLKTRLNLVLRLSLSWPRVSKVGLMACPFFVSALMVELYSLDVIFLSKFMDEVAVGWYSAASKVVGSLRFLPIALSTALFPAFSVLYESERGRVSTMFLRSQDFMMWLAFPAAAGGFILARDFIPWVYGVNYYNSITPFQIMSLSLIPTFLYYPIAALLNACDQQRVNMSSLVFSILIHIACSILLIPRLGIKGAAISAIVSSTLLFGTSIVSAYHLVGFEAKTFVQSVLKASGATIPMAAVLILLQGKIHFIILVSLGMVAYLGAAYFLQGITGGRFEKREALRRWHLISRVVRLYPVSESGTDRNRDLRDS
jgi:O-antigen/teichoic acid export membrane protein